MSPIGRIFIVLNLILAAVFLGWASNLVGASQDYKARLELEQKDHANTKETLGDEIASLKSQLAAAQDTQRQYREERDRNDDRATSLEAQLNDAQNENAQLRGEVSKMNETISNFNETIASLEQAKSRAVDLANEAERERDEATAAAAAAESGQRDVQEELEDAGRQIAKLQMALTDAKKQISTKETQLATLVDVTGVNISDIMAQPQIEAAVLSVFTDLEPGLVSISAGSEQGVKKGMTFEIYRGNTYKGRVRVENVRDTFSSALVTLVAEGTTMSQGDSASTRL